MIKSGQKIVFQVTGEQQALSNFIISKFREAARKAVLVGGMSKYVEQFPDGEEFSDNGVRVSKVEYENGILTVVFEAVFSLENMGIKFCGLSASVREQVQSSQPLCEVKVLCRDNADDTAIDLIVQLNERAHGLDAVFEHLKFGSNGLSVYFARETFNSVREVLDVNNGRFRAAAAAGMYAPLDRDAPAAKLMPNAFYNKYHVRLKEPKKIAVILQAYTEHALCNKLSFGQLEKGNKLSFELLCNLIQEMNILGVVN